MTILKLYQILLTKTQGKDKPGTNTTRIKHEQNMREGVRANILELEV